MRRPTFGLALRPNGLFLHYRHAGPIHLHIQDGNRFTHHDRQIQLHRPLDLFPLACGDVFAYGFRYPLYGFGGHVQIGEEFHLLASVVKGHLLSHHCLHAAHPGREFGIFDVQFDIGGKLPGMAVLAQVIRA